MTELITTEIPRQQVLGSRSKYIPHQGKCEMKRRLRQVASGQLRGTEQFIPTTTRFGACGLYYDSGGQTNQWLRKV